MLELNVLVEGTELRGDPCGHSVGSKSVGTGISWGKLRASDTAFLGCFTSFALSLAQKLRLGGEGKPIIQILP